MFPRPTAPKSFVGKLEAVEVCDCDLLFICLFVVCLLFVSVVGSAPRFMLEVKSHRTIQMLLSPAGGCCDP
jgi:hypothetical protein